MRLNYQSPLRERTRDELKARAEARFKSKQAQVADAPKAKTDYRAAEQAKLDQLQRLKAERLAREAAAKH
jgi:hypothetical protein